MHWRTPKAWPRSDRGEGRRAPGDDSYGNAVAHPISLVGTEDVMHVEEAGLGSTVRAT